MRVLYYRGSYTSGPARADFWFSYKNLLEINDKECCVKSHTVGQASERAWGCVG
jgi:hypothetical protein